MPQKQSLHIANIMLGKGKGGLEQASVDYAKALNLSRHAVINIVCQDGWAETVLKKEKLPFLSLRLPYNWNLYEKHRLAGYIAGCDMVFVHGNRAANFLPVKKRPGQSFIAIAHSRFFKNMAHFDSIIALTQESLENLRQNFPQKILYQIPNMIEMPQDMKQTPFKSPPVIAGMGRHSPEKGFDLFLDSLALLRKRGIPFQGILAGDGESSRTLKQQAHHLGLDDVVSFPGWIDDKDAFFANVDIFCLPSRKESFGLALLEAMARAIPCVATDCTGPRALIQNGDTGYLCRTTAESLADALEKTLDMPELSQRMGIQARGHIKENYTIEAVAARLDECFFK